MSRSLNQVFLIGNLTRDPEVRALPSGDEFCRFSLALNYSYKSADGEMQESVDFVDITAWGNLAAVVKNYCHKGKQVMVQGRLQSSSWEKDGQTRSKLEVRAVTILLLGGRSNEGTSADNQYAASTSEASSKPKATAKDKAASEDEEYQLADLEYDDEVNPEDIPF